jgi:hypothetical protein
MRWGCSGRVWARRTSNTPSTCSTFFLGSSFEFFTFAFGGDVRYMGALTCFFFHGAVSLACAALDFVLRALSHLISPYHFLALAESSKSALCEIASGSRRRDSPDGRSASVESKPEKRQKSGPPLSQAADFHLGLRVTPIYPEPSSLESQIKTKQFLRR